MGPGEKRQAACGERKGRGFSGGAEEADKSVCLSLHFHLFCLAWADPKVSKRGSTLPQEQLCLMDWNYKNQYENAGVESRLCGARSSPAGPHCSPGKSTIPRYKIIP